MYRHLLRNVLVLRLLLFHGESVPQKPLGRQSFWAYLYLFLYHHQCSHKVGPLRWNRLILVNQTTFQFKMNLSCLKENHFIILNRYAFKRRQSFQMLVVVEALRLMKAQFSPRRSDYYWAAVVQLTLSPRRSRWKTLSQALLISSLFPVSYDSFRLYMQNPFAFTLDL